MRRRWRIDPEKETRRAQAVYTSCLSTMESFSSLDTPSELQGTVYYLLLSTQRLDPRLPIEIIPYRNFPREPENEHGTKPLLREWWECKCHKI